jgi:hypothetical protein
MFKTGSQQFSITLHRENLLEDETVFKNEAASTVNADAYDIVKLFGTGAQLTSISKDGKFLAANCLPISTSYDTIPLSISATTSGNYVFQFRDAEILAGNKPIHLIDYKTGSFVNVKTQNSYAFTIDVNEESSMGNERFVLIIGEININAINELVSKQGQSQIVLYPTQTSGTITLQNTQLTLGKTQITLIDISGKEVLHQTISNWDNHAIQLDLSGQKAGTYFVKVLSDTHSQILRCVKY